MAEVRDKIAVTQLGLNEARTDEAEINVCLAYAQNFIQTINQVWFDAPPLLKIKLQSMVFPKGLKYKFEDISNHDLSLPFKLNREFEESIFLNVTPSVVVRNSVIPDLVRYFKLFSPQMSQLRLQPL